VRFLNVGMGVNANKKPEGVLVQDSASPNITGMSGYFAWVEGSDHVYLGNYIANSTRQHGIRTGGADRVLVAYNDITNLDRRDEGDQYDVNIQTLTLHVDNYSYVYNNSFSAGRVEVGPLGGGDGLSKDWQNQRVNWTVVEDNTFHDGSYLDLSHGTNHLMVRGNVFNQVSGIGIDVDGYNTTYQRGISDLIVTNNTLVNTGAKGTFMFVGGAVEGITLTDNVMIAPNITPGVGMSSGVYVNQNGLSSFREINGNVWPTAKPTNYAEGGVMFVGASMDSAGYRDAIEWNSLPQVGQDIFQNRALGDTYSLKIDGRVVGSSLPMGARVAA